MTKSVSKIQPGFGPNVQGVLTPSCDNPATQFLLSSSYIVVPSGSQNTQPFVQGKSLTFDPSNKYPVGVTFYFLQAENASQSYGAGGQIICCSR